MGNGEMPFELGAMVCIVLLVIVMVGGYYLGYFFAPDMSINPPR